MAKEYKITIEVWDYWVEDNSIYTLLEFIEQNELHLIKREINDN